MAQVSVEAVWKRLQAEEYSSASIEKMKVDFPGAAEKVSRLVFFANGLDFDVITDKVIPPMADGRTPAAISSRFSDGSGLKGGMIAVDAKECDKPGTVFYLLVHEMSHMLCKHSELMEVTEEIREKGETEAELSTLMVFEGLGLEPKVCWAYLRGYVYSRGDLEKAWPEAKQAAEKILGALDA